MTTDTLFLLLQIAITFTFVAVFALFAVYAERKVAGFIQDRLGPTEVGPYGLLQTVADILKMILKESILPKDANKWLFILAPFVLFISVFAGYAALPVNPNLIGASVNVGILYILAIVAIDIIGLLMAGWGSNSKYALIGSIRGVAQIVSYEIPTALSLLAAIMMFGTLDLQEIAKMQGIFSDKSVNFFGFWNVQHLGGILGWSVIRYPHLLIAFIIYFIASLAECNRAPFDIPEAESELVSGFHTEYTGFRFAIVFLAEYGKMVLVSVMGAVVFLGGWNTLFPNLQLGGFRLSLANWTSGEYGHLSSSLWGFFWLILKTFSLIFVQMWIRWTFPRLRADQLMSLCWKYLTPISLVLFFISGIWKLWEVGAF